MKFDFTPDPKVLIALTHTPMQPLDALCELIDNAMNSEQKRENCSCRKSKKTESASAWLTWLPSSRVSRKKSLRTANPWSEG